MDGHLHHGREANETLGRAGTNYTYFSFLGGIHVCDEVDIPRLENEIANSNKLSQREQITLGERLAKRVIALNENRQQTQIGAQTTNTNTMDKKFNFIAAIE